MSWVGWLLIVGILVLITIWAILKRPWDKPDRVRHQEEVPVPITVPRCSVIPRASQRLEDSPTYRFLEQKLQELDHEIETLPPTSVRRRFLEAQLRIYLTIRAAAQLAFRVRTKTDSNNINEI